MEKCELIRTYFDRPALTTDIIVGFPGETDEEFETTRQNLLKLQLYEMHIFKYSRRKNTVADRMPNQVPDVLKDSRSNCLLEMTAKHKAAFEHSFAGEEVDVLVEEIIMEDGKEYLRGHTDRYIVVDRQITSLDEHELVNNIVPMTIKE